VAQPKAGVQPEEPKPRRKRRPHRRDEILTAATRLFHEKGYHATGMDDIGAAAGITGPAIYRHFKSKEDILETLLTERSSAVVDRASQIVSEAKTPAAALDGLIKLYVETLLDNPALGHVGLFERRTLRPEVRAVVERAERHYFEDWVHALTQVRPELSDTEARVVIQALTGLGLLAATYRSGLEREMLEPLITSMMTKAASAEQPRVRRRASAATASAASAASAAAAAG
jgi:AcrR family transcriptional regulator